MLRFSHGRTCEGDTEVTALSLCVCTVENEGREEYNYSRSVDECDQERRNNIMNLSLLSFSLIGEAVTKRLDAAGLCRICTENGIDRIDLLQEELRFYGRDKLKKAMGESGVSLGSLIASVDFLGAPDKADERLRAALDDCREMGTDQLMIVPGQSMDNRKKRFRSLSRSAMMEEAKVFFRKAVEEGQKAGITVGLEDTPQTVKPFCTISEMKTLLEAVPGLRLILDTGNIFVGDPQADLLDYYEALKPYIMRIHLKDVVRGRFPRKEMCIDGLSIAPVVTGSGILPMAEFLRRLKADGYDGDLCIEYAAPKSLHGGDHSKAVAAYADFIRAAWDGKDVRPPYIEIEGVNKPVSRIFFGTAMMPLLAGKESDYLLDAMYALGITAFDCARGYGMAEKALGTWIKHRNNREKVVILTKCGNVSLRGQVCVNREVVEKELAKSLKVLGTEYVDIFLLHRDDPHTPVGELIEVLNEKQREGKIRVFGVSNWTKERIAEANAYAEAHGLNGFTVSSPNFGIAEQVEDPWGGDCVTVSGDANKEVRAWYAEKQMPVLAYSSLGRGFFTGKFKSGDYEGAKKVLDGAAQKGYLHPVNMERLARCEKLAEEQGCTVSDIAMRYIFGSEMKVCAVVSTSSAARMRQNIEASLKPLTKEEIGFLETGER